MTNYFLHFTFLLIVSLSLTSCDPDDPVIDNEEEVITTLVYALDPTDGGTEVFLIFTDLDGDGGEDPTIMSAPLAANTTYNGTLQVINQSDIPNEDVTLEIMEEEEDHQFFFQSNLSNINIEYNDNDANGDPVGIKSVLTTGEAEIGVLTITLKPVSYTHLTLPTILLV